VSLITKTSTEDGSSVELHEPNRVWSTYTAISWCIAALLLASAGLKGYALATAPTVGSGFFSSKPVLIGIVEVEFILAALLLSGLWKQQVRWLTMAVFTLFAGVAGYKVWTGAASCGCFGRIEVDPRYTFVLDILVVSLLFAFGPEKNLGSPPQLRRTTLAIFTSMVLVIGAGGGVAMALYQPASLTGEELPEGGPGSLVVLEPETWIGKKFPLLKHIDVGSQVESGSWVVVLHRSDCHTCQKALPLYRELAGEGEFVAGKPSVALIEMPGSEKPHVGPSGRHLIYGKLQPTRDWFATTPVAVLLRDGLVIAAATGEEAANLGWLTQATSTGNLSSLIAMPLNVTGKLLDGGTFSSAELKGKVVLVDFWATWCGPCVRNMPEIQALYKKYHGQGLEIVGFSLDQSGDPLREFLAAPANKGKMPWPQVFPGNAMADQLAVRSIPTIVLLDREGIVRFAGNPPSNLEAIISALMSGRK
jgi:thiol-disulfide isomerase/thioredoxin